MKRILKFWKIVIVDLLAVICMVAAIATGWLPGPGGIPLFIVGLSLLAIHHEWAKKYIDMLKDYADRLGDIIFVDNPKVQAVYDVTATGLVGLSSWFLYRHSAVWMISLGVSSFFLGATIFLGNRGRWPRLKSHFKRKR